MPRSEQKVFGRDSCPLKRREKTCLRLLELKWFKYMLCKNMGKTSVTVSLKRWQMVNNYNAWVEKWVKKQIKWSGIHKNVFFWLNLCLSYSSIHISCTFYNKNLDWNTHPYLYYPVMLCCYVMLCWKQPNLLIACYSLAAFPPGLIPFNSILGLLSSGDADWELDFKSLLSWE